jgi:hypothetical protein
VADSSVVVVRRFGVAVADKPVPAPRYAPIADSTTLMPGDTVYLIRYAGGDWFAAMVHGHATRIHAFWGSAEPGMLRPLNTPSYGRVLQDLDTEWWVHVRLAPAVAGWINMTDVQSVAGPDACSQ